MQDAPSQMVYPVVMADQHYDPEFERWPPPALAAAPTAMPGWPVTLWRGVRGVCPRCGEAPIFRGYLKVRPVCEHCAAPLGEMPADDAPPYVAMVVVLQLLALFVVFAIHGAYLPGPLMALLLLAILAGICMVALRLAKGAVIGILLKLGLRREKLIG